MAVAANIGHATSILPIFSLANFQNIYDMSEENIILFVIVLFVQFAKQIRFSSLVRTATSFDFEYIELNLRPIHLFIHVSPCYIFYLASYVSGISAVGCSFSRTVSLLVISKRNNNGEEGKKERNTAISAAIFSRQN